MQNVICPKCKSELIIQDQYVVGIWTWKRLTILSFGTLIVIAILVINDAFHLVG